MLTVYFPGATSKCQAYLGHNATKDASLSNVTSVRLGPITCSTVSPRLDFCCYNTVDCFRCSWSYWKDRDQLNTGLLPLVVSRKWLCRSRSSLSPDDEYRSSRNIAISLLRRYRNVIDRGGGDTLNDFISAGVNAYALGCSNEGLRKELIAIKESGLEVGGIESYSRTTIKSKIVSNEVDECILWVSIIFITILCTPQPTVVRWSSTPPVSDEILLQWKGFCALIANAYYIRGMAWLPVKTLQLEQTAVMGHAEEPSVVSSRMRLVFSTLEVVSPQWPKV